MPPAAELRRPKILIAGSGVGGLATAVALRRDGLDVEVLEQAAGPEEIRVGGGLHLWPNAMRGLQRLGLADTVARAGETIDRLEWLTPDGLRIAGVDLRATARALGAPAVGVRRSDLLGVLLDAAGEETISFGLEVSGFEQDAAGVTVRCTDGREVRGDVLVGADGLRSTIRAHVLGDAELRSPGVHVYQAVAEGGTPAPAAVFAEVWGTGVRCGYYPVRQGTFWFAFVRTAELTTRDGTNARRMLLALTHDWTAPPRGLLEATPESAIVHSELVARDPVDRWSDGRVTLLGDAAHPMTPFTGQGACQAIEDAVVLSSCLREEPDVATALGRYELERVPRTTEVARRSWAAASAAGSRDRALSPRTSRAFAATFERVIWRQLEQTIGYEF